MADAPQKVCRLCGKDVSSAKRVKDAKGHYYCEPCYATAAAKARGAQPAGAPRASVPAPAPANDDLYGLSDEPAAPASRPVAPAAPSPAKPPALPSRCPACGTPVLTRSVICVGCKRDLTKMDKLLAIQAEAAKPPSGADRLGEIVGVAMKWGFRVGLVLVAIFLAWGLWMMFSGPGNDYPTSRERLVRDYLTYIAKGTDKGYDHAFVLVSFRERTTNNDQEVNNYKRVFARMNGDFVKKYGNDWIKRVKINVPSHTPTGEESTVNFTIDNDTYTVLVQVEIAVDQSIANLAAGRARPSYPEDGKNRFGVIQVDGYHVLDKRKPFDPSKFPGKFPAFPAPHTTAPSASAPAAPAADAPDEE